MKCGVCGEVLQFERGKGYLHPNGKLYVQREVMCEDRIVGRRCAGGSCKRCGGSGRIMIDDHCSQPVEDNVHLLGCSSGVGQRCTCATIRRDRAENERLWRERMEAVGNQEDFLS